jgi:hypothetical protein
VAQKHSKRYKHWKMSVYRETFEIEKKKYDLHPLADGVLNKLHTMHFIKGVNFVLDSSEIKIWKTLISIYLVSLASIFSLIMFTTPVQRAMCSKAPKM